MNQISIDSLVLRCPKCKREISSTQDLGYVLCQGCQLKYLRIPNGGIAFIDVDESVVTDAIDKLKSRGKRYPRFYNLLLDVVSPVYPQPTFERMSFLNKLKGKGLTVLNLGSGSSSFGSEVLNFDILPYDTVDVICSIDNIPLADNSVDAIVNIAVLEHVPNPDLVISEFNRILKPGGQLYCFIPFIQGFHASPWDFQRFTKSGIEIRFKDFEIDWIHSVGPTSGMLWVLQEWVALVFSFGSKRLHSAIWIFVVLITWPIKFLDVILRFHPKSENIASGFSIRAIKPE